MSFKALSYTLYPSYTAGINLLVNGDIAHYYSDLLNTLAAGFFDSLRFCSGGFERED